MRLTAFELGLLAIALAVVAVVVFERAGSSPKQGVVRASWTMTPGALNPAVTQASIRSTICKKGWTRTVRPPTSYTNALKRFQMQKYGLHGPPSAFQEDHLISLELGGHPSDPRNLWPEPYPRAAQADQIENQLNGLVCSGTISLTEGRRRESALKHADG
jgi:hypothetical protein